MTPTEPSGSNRLIKRRRYRRLLYGVMVAGVLGLIAVESAGCPFVGVGLYWLGVIVFFAILCGTTSTLFDEPWSVGPSRTGRAPGGRAALGPPCPRRAGWGSQAERPSKTPINTAIDAGWVRIADPLDYANPTVLTVPDVRGSQHEAYSGSVKSAAVWRFTRA